MILVIQASADTSEHIWPANLEKHLKILQEVAHISVLIVLQLPLPFHFRLLPFPPCSLDLWPHVLSNLSSKGCSSSACHPIVERAYGQSLRVLRIVSIHSEVKSNHSANPQAPLVGLFVSFFLLDWIANVPCLKQAGSVPAHLSVPFCLLTPERDCSHPAPLSLLGLFLLLRNKQHSFTKHSQQNHLLTWGVSGHWNV